MQADTGTVQEKQRSLGTGKAGEGEAEAGVAPKFLIWARISCFTALLEGQMLRGHIVHALPTEQLWSRENH